MLHVHVQYVYVYIAIRTRTCMYMFNSNRCQQSESEHVECDVVGSAGHHPHLILQLLGTGLGIHFNQTRLQQML